MQVMIRRYDMVPGSFEELAKSINDGFLDIVQKIPGFHDYYFFEAEPGVLVTVSIFDDLDGAYESVRRAAEYIRDAKITAFLPTAPEVLVGEDRSALHSPEGA